jgi:hypothetical protein
MARIVAQIRCRWPKVRILLRGDSGFAREELMAWCEANRVHFLFGLQQNSRLNAAIARELERAEAKSRRTGGRRGSSRFMWMTVRETWGRRRRVVGKAEFTLERANPRYVVTSLKRRQCKTKYLYEKLYCARGEMENRIKECQLDLYADRTSTATMRANQTPTSAIGKLVQLAPCVGEESVRAPNSRVSGPARASTMLLHAAG